MAAGDIQHQGRVGCVGERETIASAIMRMNAMPARFRQPRKQPAFLLRGAPARIAKDRW